MSLLSGEWHDLTWPHKGPRFNLHHLQEMSMVFKMGVLAQKLGINQKLQSYYKTILLYCLKCRKKTESENPKVAKKNKGKPMLLSKCAVCDGKKLRFIKEQEASGLLSNLNKNTDSK